MTHANRIGTPAALLGIVLLLAAGAARGAEENQEADGLSTALLDRAQGTPAEARPALLAACGIEARSWALDFDQRVAEVAAQGEKAATTDLDNYRQVLLGARLARLLGEKAAAEPLLRLAAALGVPPGLVYEAMVSLAALGGAEEFLLTTAGTAEPTRAWLAVLALGLETEPRVVAGLAEIRGRRGADSELSAAFQFVDLYRHDSRLYATLGEALARLAFVEERLRRAYNPVSGETQTSDPYSAGHPVSRWALDEWQRLTAAEPAAAAAYISAVTGYPAPGLEPGYRGFLANLAAPAARDLVRSGVEGG